MFVVTAKLTARNQIRAVRNARANLEKAPSGFVATSAKSGVITCQETEKGTGAGWAGQPFTAEPGQRPGKNVRSSVAEAPEER